MALSATTVHEIRPGGNDVNNAGIFDPGVAAPGVDYSTQDSPQFSYSDLVIGATNTQVTSAAHPFDSTSPGNGLNVTGGSGFTTGRYIIKSVSGSVATLDRAVGTAGSTGGTGFLGGGWATPGAAMAIAVASNTLFIKSGTYGLSASINVSGGRLNITVGGASGNAPFQIVGYNTNRSLINSDTPPVLDANAGVGAFAHIALNSNYIRIRNLKMTNSHGGATGASYSLYMGGVFNNVERCISDGMPYGFYHANTDQHLFDCVATNFSVGGFFNFGGTRISCHFCYASGTGGGFQGVSCERCISYNNQGTAGDGFIAQSQSNVRYSNCVAYGNARTGFRIYYDTSCINCVAVNNAAFGFDPVSAGALALASLLNCAGYNNTLGNISTDFPSWAVQGFISLSASPFTNPAGGDFSLNGPALKAAAYPTTFYGLSTSNYEDVGAAQSKGATPKTATTTALTATPNPSPAPGQSVTLTATVTGSGGTPTGTVTFSADGTTLGTVPLNAGTASLAVNTLAVGGHAVVASYSGDSAFLASSGTILQNVNLPIGRLFRTHWADRPEQFADELSLVFAQVPELQSSAARLRVQLPMLLE